MKKIIPFSQDIIFKTNVAEITSISLEHTLQSSDNNFITGELILSGDYKMSDSSTNTEEFSYNLPFDISMDDKYILDDVVIDIDDFYYELINNNILSVNIDVLVDRLEEKEEQDLMTEEVETIIEEKEDITPEIELELVDNDEVEPIITSEVYARSEENEMKDVTISSIEEVDEGLTDEPKEEVRTLFDNFDTSTETYTTYKIYIIKDGDTIESILQAYDVTKEEVEQYNDLRDLKIGDKVIIPSVMNEKI